MRILGLNPTQIVTVLMAIAIILVLDRKAKHIHLGSYLGYLVWVGHLLIFYCALSVYHMGYVCLSPALINTWSNVLRLHIVAHILGSLILERERGR